MWYSVGIPVLWLKKDGHKFLVSGMTQALSTECARYMRDYMFSPPTFNIFLRLWCTVQQVMYTMFIIDINFVTLNLYDSTYCNMYNNTDSLIKPFFLESLHAEASTYQVSPLSLMAILNGSLSS